MGILQKDLSIGGFPVTSEELSFAVRTVEDLAFIQVLLYLDLQGLRQYMAIGYNPCLPFFS